MGGKKITEKTIGLALRTFRRRKVCTIEEISALLDCSKSATSKQLKKWKTMSSYNKNGRYYTLPDLPNFDQNGLWRYRGIGFSIHGNLKRTVVQLVSQSEAGLGAAEFKTLLGGEPTSFLSLFRNHPALVREKYLRSFVYFSAEKNDGRKQRQRRAEICLEAQMPSDAEAIAILAEAIKHPLLNPWDLAARLKKNGLDLSARSIHNLFMAHGLPLEKKTPDSQR